MGGEILSKFQAPKGVSEYVPPNSNQFEYVRDQLLKTARLAGYNLIELPVFEDTEVFTRGVGESTDVVSKEMYTFEDRGGRSITLRPEGTAGVMRAVIEHNLDKGQLPVKLFYTGPFFRAERPQAGRYRQFYQVGIEAIGYNDPEIDVEVIAQIELWNQLDAFISGNDYLNSRRGQFVERQGLVLPWVHGADLNITQDFYIKYKNTKHTLRVTMDMFNFTNFLSKDLGVNKVPTTMTPLTFVRMDTDGKTPIFSFPYLDGRNKVPFTDSFRDNVGFSSRWQMQIGVRYLFN